jgi:hypothetical protein
MVARMNAGKNILGALNYNENKVKSGKKMIKVIIKSSSFIRGMATILRAC